MTGAFVIEGDDITLEGNGHRTDGGFASPPGGNVGVFVLNYDGITIKNLDIGGENLPNGSISLHWGVYTKYSDNLTVSNTTMKVKNQGIITFGHPSCHYNDPRYDHAEGDQTSCSNNHIIENNLVALQFFGAGTPGGHPLFTRYSNGHQYTGNTFYGGIEIILFEMDNATFTDNIFSDINYYGVRVEWSSDNTFTNNTFARSFYRTLTIISLSGRIGTPRRIASDARIPGKGGNNTFTGNTFSGTGSAMLLHRQANNTTITGNNFKDNGPTHIALTPVTGTIIDSNWYDAAPLPKTRTHLFLRLAE